MQGNHMDTRGPAYRGMSFTTWRRGVFGTPAAAESIAAMRRAGVDSVMINFAWYQETPTSTQITEDPVGTPTWEEVASTIRVCHQQGIRTILKPMVNVRNHIWRGHILPSDAWFAEYTKFMAGYARMAREEGCEMLCMGNEFKDAEHAEAGWRGVVKELRQIFSGPLVYGANHDSWNRMHWWDAVDYIGISAYFSLSSQLHPSKQEMVAGWQPHLRAIEKWRQERGLTQPVMFSEVGFRSGTGAAIRPYQYETKLEVNFPLQADAYEATLIATWDLPWLAGLWWWDWHPYGHLIGQDAGFSPQNKPAEQVLARYYRAI